MTYAYIYLFTKKKEFVLIFLNCNNRSQSFSHLSQCFHIVSMDHVELNCLAVIREEKHSLSPLRF